MPQAATRTALALREGILRGDFPPGARLGEVELAGRLEVSRTPVREALSRLAAEGLVELRPGRGARVRSWTPEQLRQIFEVRLRLEPYAVRLAVPRLDADGLAELDVLAAQMCRLGRSGPGRDLAAVVQRNRRFHGALVDAADSPALAASLTAVIHGAVVHQNFHHYAPDALARSLAHHVELVAAARAGDPDWAEAVMRAHLGNARATMLAGHRTATPGAGG